MLWYNFRWTNLPEAVLRGLSRDLDLGVGDPAKTLRSAFGARPTDAFVQTAWPSLRDRWLAHHTEARQLIVDELWQIGLGDGARPANREAEMAFLRSRNKSVSVNHLRMTLRLWRLQERLIEISSLWIGQVGPPSRPAGNAVASASAIIRLRAA
jgi:hypothetical protein